MKLSLQLEELAQFAASIVLLVFLEIDISWWLWPFIFLAPDVGMAGYLINTKIGAWTYNLLHHKLVALAVLGIGYFSGNFVLLVSGIVLFGHSSMDRMMGFGLKYPDNFKHTHLGVMK